MINLMPDDAKKQLKAARTNSILMRYTAVVLGAFGFLVLILAGSVMLLNESKASSEALIEANQTEAAVFNDTQTAVSALSENLTGARGILDQQVNYSQVLRILGEQMPEGAVMRELTLSQANFTGQPITVSIAAISTEKTTEVQDRFRTLPGFTAVEIGSVAEVSEVPGYAVTATLTITLDRTVAI